MSYQNVIATEDITVGQSVFASQGFVRAASIGADKNAGTAVTSVKKGQVAQYDTTTRQLRCVPGQRSRV